nr:GTP cyclohydrolase II [Pseudomonas boanensis]
MPALRISRSFSVSVVFVAASQLPTPFGVFTMHGFLDEANGKEHVALTLGEVADGAPVLGRLHSECLTGDALFSLRCDCGFQLEAALRAIANEGRGVLLYLRQEGRGIGLLNKIRAYELQDGGADTVEANERLGFGADQRDYAMCQPMLEHLGITAVKLMTNNPRKVKALESYGLNVAERVPLQTGLNPHNRKYLATKAGKLGHMLGNLHQAEAES